MDRPTILNLIGKVTLDDIKEWASVYEKTIWFCEFSEMSVNDRWFDERQDALENYMTQIAKSKGWEIINR
jgi:hypothetical protein